MGNYFFWRFNVYNAEIRYLLALIIDIQAFFQKRSEAKFKGQNN